MSAISRYLERCLYPKNVAFFSKSVAFVHSPNSQWKKGTSEWVWINLYTCGRFHDAMPIWRRHFILLLLQLVWRFTFEVFFFMIFLLTINKWMVWSLGELTMIPPYLLTCNFLFQCIVTLPLSKTLFVRLLYGLLKLFRGLLHGCMCIN